MKSDGVLCFAFSLFLLFAVFVDWMGWSSRGGPLTPRARRLALGGVGVLMLAGLVLLLRGN